MNFENSEEECDEFRSRSCYWNNWIPKNDSVNANVVSEYVSKKSNQNLIPQGEIKLCRSISSEIENATAPSSLGKTNVRNELKLLEKKQKNIKGNESVHTQEGVSILNESHSSKMSEILAGGEDACKCDDSKGNFTINKDWGKRIELHNILHVNDGEKVWNVISRGIFSEVKLWKNEYGNICFKASGKISVKGVSEKSLIEINTGDNLRKMLNLSSMQWSALCEAIEEKNCCLSFNAFQDVDMGKLSPLEKLWFFVCKRRHFLPNICVLGKISGAVKLLKEFKIIPKLVVLEIRDYKGDEIS